MIRAFVALPLPDAIRRTLAATQAGLPAGRPVAPENFHVTLVFIGEQPGPVLEDVHLALSRIRARPLSLRLDGLGVFGTERPRSLHARIAPAPALDHLREKVLRCVREAGLELTYKRFHPHVTLARFGSQSLKSDVAAELRAFTERRLALSSEPFEVDCFVLYRSILGKNGPTYEEMATYPLG